MFYYVSGTVTHKEPGFAVIDCGGVGYLCHTSFNTLRALETGKTAKLFTHLHVREDLFDLYGFNDAEELDCFRMLIGISGIGPKAALSILSGSTPERFALAVLTGDERVLTSAQGIGKKTAQRIILELRDKVSKQQGAAAPAAAAIGTGAASGGLGDAMQALMVLGYSQAEAAGALQQVDAVDLSAEQLIRAALKNLVKAK